jgi:hypothetical protein
VSDRLSGRPVPSCQGLADERDKRRALVIGVSEASTLDDVHVQRVDIVG